MIHVYVWLPTEENYGHASMYVERHDPDQSCYVSWWPAHTISLPGTYPSATNSYSEDVAAEGAAPSRCFMLNFGGEHLSEMAMVQAWRERTRVRVWNDQVQVTPYRLLARNCCTTVAYLLREPGGAGRYSDWEPVTWWDPNDIVTYMSILNRHFVVAEPLVPRVPPNIH